MDKPSHHITTDKERKIYLQSLWQLRVSMEWMRVVSIRIEQRIHVMRWYGWIKVIEIWDETMTMQRWGQRNYLLFTQANTFCGVISSFICDTHTVCPTNCEQANHVFADYSYQFVDVFRIKGKKTTQIRIDRASLRARWLVEQQASNAINKILNGSIAILCMRQLN